MNEDRYRLRNSGKFLIDVKPTYSQNSRERHRKEIYAITDFSQE